MDFKSIKNKLGEKSPEILTGVGIAGMLSSVIFAVKATPKAMQLVEDELEYNLDATKMDIFRAAWKPYVPAATTFIFSSACLIGANSINHKRNAAIATACSLSEYALREYRNKVVEVIGEEKEREIRDAVSRDRVEARPLTSEVIITGNGDVLCFETLSGRYFKSNVDRIEKAMNILNRRVLSENYCSVNDYYEALGLDPIDVGEELGWNTDDGMIELHYSSQLTVDNQPCVVLDPIVMPRHGYSKF